MKSQRIILWLIALLIVYSCYITMETFPEFHVLSPAKMQEIVGQLGGNSKRVVAEELVAARWSGENAQFLANSSLAIDVVVLVAVGVLIVKSYWRRKDAAERRTGATT